MAKLGDQVVVLRQGVTFDAQVFMGNLMKTRAVKNDGGNKPLGGLWTSSYVGDKTDWLDWCSAEMPRWVGTQAVVLTPTSGKILHIESEDDLQDVKDIYPWKAGRERYGNDYLVDWEEVAKDYDAVHVSGKMARTYELGTWQTESTVWFRPKLKWKDLVSIENKCRLRAAARLAMAARIAKSTIDRLDWADVAQSAKGFNRILQQVKTLTRRSPSSLVGDRQAMNLIESVLYGEGDASPTVPTNPIGMWIIRNWGRGSRWDIHQIRDDVRSHADALHKELKGAATDPDWLPLVEDSVQYLYESLEEQAKIVSKYTSQAGPEKFTYGPFKVHNPGRFSNEIVQKVLGAIDRVVGLFKARGVTSLLTETVKLIRIYYGKDDTTHGRYHAWDRSIDVSVQAVGSSSARLWDVWVHEVLLHEIGHHLHLSLLPPDAKAEWDAAWEPVDEAIQQQEAEIGRRFAVSPEDRRRFWEMLKANRGNLRPISSKLKGLDRVKFHEWLRKPHSDVPPLVTPKQLRWTTGPHTQDLVTFLSMNRDELLGVSVYQETPWSEERKQEWYDRREKRYLIRLGVEKAGNFPLLDPEAIEDYRKTDKTVSDALDALGIPSDYGRTNVKEDFAESFVAFMGNPSKLSDTARYRMQRTLSLAGLYGKPVMRLGADSPLRIVEQGRSGTHWEMDLRQDRFVHFTSSKRALEIMASGRLLHNPPDKISIVEGVYAVSVVWGQYTPSVQTYIERQRSGEGETVAILFRTSTKPKMGFPEEVDWDRDVVLKNAQIIPARQAAAMLQRTPLGGQVGGFGHWVTYR